MNAIVNPAGSKPSAKTERELLIATSKYAKESKLQSWWVVGSTFVLMFGALSAAAFMPWWPVQLAFSIVAGLILVRGFIMLHDYAHGAILRKSKLAHAIFVPFSMFFMTGFHYWRDTHNFHHNHVLDLREPSHGTFPVMTLEEWQNAGFWKRFNYRINRSPLTLLFAYFTVFMLSNAIMPFLSNPKKHWAAGMAVVVHVGLIVALWLLVGPMSAVFGVIIPYFIASSLGAYLFYAQHNFPEMDILPPEEWSKVAGSLQSTSFFKMNPAMMWFTGQIGYHHIHHMNPAIPFYRLKTVMDEVPEMRDIPVTTLKPRDIWGCLRLKLWDAAERRMLSWREARKVLQQRNAQPTA